MCSEQFAIAKPSCRSRFCSRDHGCSAQPQILSGVAIGSGTTAHDYLFLSNYATLHVYDALARVHGVGQVIVFGARDYGRRIWLDPAKMARHSVSPPRVSSVLTEQNVVGPAGTVGAEPAPAGSRCSTSPR